LVAVPLLEGSCLLPLRPCLLQVSAKKLAEPKEDPLEVRVGRGTGARLWNGKGISHPRPLEQLLRDSNQLDPALN
jgi:hypothetical protein